MLSLLEINSLLYVCVDHLLIILILFSLYSKKDKIDKILKSLETNNSSFSLTKFFLSFFYFRLFNKFNIVWGSCCQPFWYWSFVCTFGFYILTWWICSRCSNSSPRTHPQTSWNVDAAWTLFVMIWERFWSWIPVCLESPWVCLQRRSSRQPLGPLEVH